MHAIVWRLVLCVRMLVCKLNVLFNLEFRWSCKKVRPNLFSNFRLKLYLLMVCLLHGMKIVSASF